jgi:hypothetical protein
MERPGSVTAFGILNVVFAVFGFLGLLGTIALFSMAGTLNIPVVKIMRENPAYATWLKLTIPLGLLSCGVLLAAGVGLLRMENWAGKLSIGYAIYGIVFSILGLVMKAGSSMGLKRVLLAEFAEATLNNLGNLFLGKIREVRLDELFSGMPVLE